jgi:potassium efflux system protein
MQQRFSAAAAQQERLLQEKAAAEERMARRSDDPLERFRARRRADLLDLEAKVVKHEEMLATSPVPSLEEQSSLADHAATDFTRVKALLDDGRVSRLDAIRLNNDFRRIGPERDRLLRNEMAVAEARLQYYEDALTGVEIELLQDSLHDRFELELLKEGLPSARWADGERVLADLERNHRALLVRRRKVLEQLTDLTAQTLDQIGRRLAILDEEYSFIRTHIFWVRDQDPIGPGTVTQGARECQHVVKALMRLAQESANPDRWGRPSAEFVGASLAALGLPLGLVRLRRLLRVRIVRDLPADGPKVS